MLVKILISKWLSNSIFSIFSCKKRLMSVANGSVDPQLKNHEVSYTYFGKNKKIIEY